MWKPEKGVRFVGARVTSIMNSLMLVMGTKTWSSARTVCFFSSSVIFSALIYIKSLNVTYFYLLLPQRLLFVYKQTKDIWL